ncbi:PEP-CTERM motif protein [Burkholderiales bacterium JOSHI_001]|nr:PEP-CTERM motif protein [Burkholderiales bacterium JOSHI_001]
MKTILSSVALAAAALCASVPAAAAPVLSFSATSNAIGVGGSTTITATLSGLGADILSGYDLTFVYNPAVLQLNVIGLNGFLGSSLGATLTGGPGAYGLDDASVDSDLTLAANQADSFTMFTFDLVGLANGATTFTLGASPDFDRNFLGFADVNGDPQPLNVDVGSICIAVGTGSCDNRVPEPASYGLAGVALLAAGIAGRRRRAQTTKA